jgi:beta-lactamase superfamily II metal-dependent hydrolase
MSSLAVTLIDVGWGDSILIESEDSAGQVFYALVDSNDEPHQRSSIDFLKKLFRTRGVSFGRGSRFFQFVMASHDHSDHISGLRRIIEEFGTERFYYPRSNGAEFATLLRYTIRSSRHPNGRVGGEEWVDTSKALPNLGDAELRILHPPPSPMALPYDLSEPNNNSIVLGIRLKNAKHVLTGDCLAENWDVIATSLTSTNLRLFKVPHHGARNGTFEANGDTPWFDLINARTKLAISTHVSPHGHPDPNVLSEFNGRSFHHYRTDLHYHLTFWTDGRETSVKWSHD